MLISIVSKPIKVVVVVVVIVVVLFVKKNYVKKNFNPKTIHSVLKTDVPYCFACIWLPYVDRIGMLPLKWDMNTDARNRLLIHR